MQVFHGINATNLKNEIVPCPERTQSAIPMRLAGQIGCKPAWIVRSGPATWSLCTVAKNADLRMIKKSQVEPGLMLERVLVQHFF